MALREDATICAKSVAGQAGHTATVIRGDHGLMRLPLFGLLKGKITIAPGIDLTEPVWSAPMGRDSAESDVAATSHSEN